MGKLTVGHYASHTPTGASLIGARPSPCGECERLRAENNLLQAAQGYLKEEHGRLRAENAALREALRLALVNAYSPEDVIEITEAALAAGRE